VIAWGGDGTMNEVARAVVSTPTALGLVPGGSGNGLSRDFRIPFDPARALEHAVRAPERVVDAGEIGGRLFVNIAGIGLDAHVAGAVATRIKHRGLIPYLIATTKDLLKYTPVEYSIETDGGNIQTTALIVAIANSTQYGLGVHVAPTALVDDGSLDLVVIEDRGLARNVVRIPSVFLGGFHRKPGVIVSRVRRVTVRAAEPMLFHVDGEAIQGGTELSARVHAGALRVRA
jgi:diacylglycerol kinase (ATP)